MAYKRRMSRKVRRVAPKRRKLQDPTFVTDYMLGGSKRKTMDSAPYKLKGQNYKYKTRPDRKMPMSRNPDYREQKHQNTSDFLVTNTRFGRRYTKAKRVKKLVTNDQRLDKFTLRNYQPWGTGNGANILQSVQNGTVGNVVESPIHLFDLTAAPQSRADGVVLYPTTHYVLTFTNETDQGAVAWKTYDGSGQLFGISSDTTSTTQPIKERSFYLTDTDGHGLFTTTSTHQNVNQFPGANSLLESFKAKLLFYSCRNHCTKFEVALIQTSEDCALHEASNRATAVWQAMHKTWGYSPIEEGNNRLMYKHIKFLKRMSFVIDSPNGGGDADLGSRLRQVNFGGYLNRKCNYNWGKNTDRVAINTEDTFENGEASLEHSTHVHPKARVYMMIRAMVPYRTNGVAGTPDYNSAASYDIMLTTSHRNLVTQ